MKLIEKKCPNCGASLEFNDNDRSCKCVYCKRGFEIVRDSENDDEYSLVYTKTDKIIRIVDWILIGPIILFIIYGLYRIYLIWH